VTKKSEMFVMVDANSHAGSVVIFAIALWALLRCICYSPCMGFVVLFAVALWALLCFICYSPVGFALFYLP